MKAALLLAAGLIACQPPPPLPAIELLGERLIAPEGHWLDAERLPVLRSSADLPPATTFELVVGASHTPLRVDHQAQRGPSQLTWLALEGTPEPGVGALQLQVAGTVRHQWPIRWGPTPARRPALVPVTALSEAGKPAEALAALVTLLPTLSKEDRHFGLAEQARLLQRLGRSREAMAAWAAAGADAHALGWSSEAARCLRAAAFSAMVASDLVAVERLLGEAAVPPSGPWEAARRLLQRGHLEARLGEFARAHDSFQQAAELSLAAGADADHATAVMALGTLLVKQGQHAEAQALLTQARPFFEPPRARPVEQANWLANQGFALMTDGAAELAQARAVLTQAAALYAAHGEAERVAFCAVKLALIAHREGDEATARARVAEARRLAPDGVDMQEGPLLLLEAELAASPDEARIHLQAALAQATADGDRDLGWRAWHGLGRLEQRLGHREEARAAILKALEILDDLGRSTSVEDGRATFFADRTSPVEDALELLLEAGQVAQAFAIADAARARVAQGLESQARIGRLSPAARRTYAERLGAWSARRQAFERDRHGDRRLAGAELAAWHAARAAEQAALAGLFEELQRFLDGAVPPATPSGGSVASLQAALEPDAALLLFVPVHGRWTAFYVDQKTVQNREVVPAAPLAAWADQLADRRRLYLVPGDLPGGRQLHQTTALPVGYLPSAGVLRPPGAHPGAGVLIIADATSDLPHARAEGEALARNLPGSLLLVGDAAHREAVLAALPGARVVHFAGHGALDPTSPWDAHLDLAAGGQLTLRDVLALPLTAERVVLSGCETAGTRVVGSEHIGLAEAFVLAGAQSVVAADKKIDDAATGDWMARWYAAPGSPGEALVAMGGGPFRVVGRP